MTRRAETRTEQHEAPTLVPADQREPLVQNSDVFSVPEPFTPLTEHGRKIKRENVPVPSNLDSDLSGDAVAVWW